jgi:hypothetical protein
LEYAMETRWNAQCELCGRTKDVNRLMRCTYAADRNALAIIDYGVTCVTCAASLPGSLHDKGVTYNVYFRTY